MRYNHNIEIIQFTLEMKSLKFAPEWYHCHLYFSKMLCWLSVLLFSVQESEGWCWTVNKVIYLNLNVEERRKKHDRKDNRHTNIAISGGASQDEIMKGNKKFSGSNTEGDSCWKTGLFSFNVPLSFVLSLEVSGFLPDSDPPTSLTEHEQSFS